MSDQVVYPKPLLVTEEKLREAREKQAKQRALKEALDKQIAQAQRRKTKENREEPRLIGARPAQRYTFNYENGRGKFVRREEGDASGGDTPVAASAQRKAIPLAPQRPSHQTNSLPPNFAMSTSEANPLARKRPEHNTNSLPVDLGLYQANGNNHNGENRGSDGGVGVRGNGRGSGVSPGAGGRKGNGNGLCILLSGRKELSPRTLSPREKDSPHDVEYHSNCLPRNFNLEDIKTQLQLQQGSPRLGLVSPRNAKHSPRIKSPQRPGGLLPPLEVPDSGNGKRPVEGNGLRALHSPGMPVPSHAAPNRQVKAKQPPAQRGRSNEGRARAVGVVGSGAPRNTNVSNNANNANVHNSNNIGVINSGNVLQVRTSDNKVEMLQKQLESRNVEMAKMREKERNWEEQVKRLKIELKNAKKKQRDLNKLVNERPRRAETAPDQPIVSTPVISDPLPRKGLVPPPPFALGKKKDFNKSCVYQQNAFRPISAPSESIASSHLSGALQPHLPPMQDSFKLASSLTRKIAFGLPEMNARRPVPIEFEHLLQFVEAQIITQQQADELWKLFANEESPLALLHRASGVSGGPCAGESAFSRADPYSPVKDNPIDESYEYHTTPPAHEDDETFDEDEMADGAHGNDDKRSSGEQSEETFETFAELRLEDQLLQEEHEEDGEEHVDG